MVALTVLLVAVGLLASGVAVTSSMRQDLISRADEGLENSVRTWAEPRGLLGDGPGPHEGGLAPADGRLGDAADAGGLGEAVPGLGLVGEQAHGT